MVDVLPNEHVARLLFTYLGLYPQVIVAFSHEILSAVVCSLEWVKVLKVSHCLVVGTKSAPTLSPAKSGEHNTEERVKLWAAMMVGVHQWDAIFWIGQH